MQKRYLVLLFIGSCLAHAGSNVCPTHLCPKHKRDYLSICRISKKLVIPVLQKAKRFEQLTPEEELHQESPYKKEVIKPRWMEWP